MAANQFTKSLLRKREWENWKRQKKQNKFETVAIKFCVVRKDYLAVTHMKLYYKSRDFIYDSTRNFQLGMLNFGRTLDIV